MRHLESFVSIADLGSFTKAAEHLHLSQPALSRQIAGLEQALGSVLFDRRPRLVLTPQGRDLVRRARAVLDAVAELERRGAEIGGEDVGELRVGVVHSLTVSIVPAVLREWSTAYPKVELRLEEFSHGDDLAAAVREGVLDVALGPRPVSWPGTAIPLFVERFVVAMGATHPLAAANGSLALADTAEYSWVHYHPSHGLAEVLDRACQGAGFVPRVLVRVRQTAVAPSLAECGGALALVPDNAVAAGFTGVVRPLRPKLDRPIVAYASGRINPLAHHLVSMIRLQRTTTGTRRR